MVENGHSTKMAAEKDANKRTIRDLWLDMSGSFSEVVQSAKNTYIVGQIQISNHQRVRLYKSSSHLHGTITFKSLNA